METTQGLPVPPIMDGATVQPTGTRRTPMDIKCAKCGYAWEPRKEAPKACPRCKTRLDAPPPKDVN